MLLPDWYQGMLLGESDPELLASLLVLGRPDTRLKQAGGLFGRPLSLRGELEGGTVGIFYGGNLDLVFRATSSAAPTMARIVREHFPEHTVSRVDICQDYDEPGVFGRMVDTLDPLATGWKPRPVKVSTHGDWLHAIDGRTLYLGSFKSQLFIRLYEKGKELAARHPGEVFSDHLTRFEVELKPEGQDKRRAATATWEQLACWTPFAAAALSAVAGLDVAPQMMLKGGSRDPEYWIARQYGSVIRTWLTLPEDQLHQHLVALLDRAGSSPNPTTAPEGAEHLRSGGRLAPWA